MPVKVFISWSGTRSQGVAEQLSKFLKKVIQSVEPFISTAMDAGVKWNEVIAKNLDEHGIGILCVTPGNAEKPWLNFEAGALSRHLDDSGRVIPYLLDFGSAGNLKPPLSQFNAVTADRPGTFKLVQTLNGLESRPQAPENLEETFEAFWPSFGGKLEEIRTSSRQPPARRSDAEKLDELLAISHQLLRREQERTLLSEPSREHVRATRAAQMRHVMQANWTDVMEGLTAATSGQLLRPREISALADGFSRLPTEQRLLLQETILNGLPLPKAARRLGISEEDAVRIHGEALKSLMLGGSEETEKDLSTPT